MTAFFNLRSAFDFRESTSIFSRPEHSSQIEGDSDRRTPAGGQTSPATPFNNFDRDSVQNCHPTIDIEEACSTPKIEHLKLNTVEPTPRDANGDKVIEMEATVGFAEQSGSAEKTKSEHEQTKREHVFLSSLPEIRTTSFYEGEEEACSTETETIHVPLADDTVQNGSKTEGPLDSNDQGPLGSNDLQESARLYPQGLRQVGSIPAP